MDQENNSLFNDLHPVVLGLAVVIFGLEVMFQLATAGLLGGSGGIGWRMAAVRDYGVFHEIAAWMFANNSYPAHDLMRLVTYPLIHGGFIHAVFVSVFAVGCDKSEQDAPKVCESVSGIEGSYTCGGACVVTDAGQKKVQLVSGERDVVAAYPDAPEGLYRVEITNTGFSETEIGVLTGKVLRTATSEVSDNHYPVLEEYVFEHDANCTASAYTKIVRNPTLGDFKACNIACTRDEAQ